MFSSSQHKDMGPLAKYFRFVDKNSHKLSKSIFGAMAKYRQHLERKQMLLGRLMEIGTDLFVMSAACSYALSLKETKGDESAIELADYFCTIAQRRIEDRYDLIADNDDRYTNEIAKKALEKSYQWLEQGTVSMAPEPKD